MWRAGVHDVHVHATDALRVRVRRGHEGGELEKHRSRRDGNCVREKIPQVRRFRLITPAVG